MATAIVPVHPLKPERKWKHHSKQIIKYANRNNKGKHNIKEQRDEISPRRSLPYDGFFEGYFQEHVDFIFWHSFLKV